VIDRLCWWIGSSKKKQTHSHMPPEDVAGRWLALCEPPQQPAPGFTSIFAEYAVTPASAARLRKNLAQIRIDLPRTWALHPSFAEGGRYLPKLERLLVAYLLQSETDYVQSMNFTAALVLDVVGGDEAHALTIVTAVWNDALGVYLSSADGFATLQRDTELLSVELKRVAPDVAAHLRGCEFDLINVTPNYWLTVFFLALSRDNAVKAIDALLMHKSRARSFFLQVTLKNLLQRRDAILAAGDLQALFGELRPLDGKGRAFCTDLAGLELDTNSRLDERWLQHFGAAASAGSLKRRHEESAIPDSQNMPPSPPRSPQTLWKRVFAPSPAQLLKHDRIPSWQRVRPPPGEMS
jgi:hypothetical protein